MTKLEESRNGMRPASSSSAAKRGDNALLEAVARVARDEGARARQLDSSTLTGAELSSDELSALIASTLELLTERDSQRGSAPASPEQGRFTRCLRRAARGGQLDARGMGRREFAWAAILVNAATLSALLLWPIDGTSSPVQLPGTTLSSRSEPVEEGIEAHGDEPRQLLAHVGQEGGALPTDRHVESSQTGQASFASGKQKGETSMEHETARQRPVAKVNRRGSEPVASGSLEESGIIRQEAHDARYAFAAANRRGFIEQNPEGRVLYSLGQEPPRLDGQVPDSSKPHASAGRRSPRALDEVLVLQQSRAAAAKAAACGEHGETRGTGQVKVKIEPWGRVSRVTHLNRDFVGAPVGWCVMQAFQEIRVPPFDGESQQLVVDFEVR